MKHPNTQRMPLVDYIRGFLVVCMVVYHAVYCFFSFSLIEVSLYSGFWWWFPRFIAAGFLLVSGWSLAASRARGQTFKEAGRRILKLAGIALVVSLATFITFGAPYFVFFGILHAIALASLITWPLAAPVRREERESRETRGQTSQGLLTFARFLLGTVILAAGLWLGTTRFDIPWLAWLGFRPANLYPVDFEPLLPWLAWFVFGIALYPVTEKFFARVGHIERFKSVSASEPAPKSAAGKKEFRTRNWLLATLVFLGRHSLIIYLVHLPALYGLAWLVSTLR